MHFLFGSSPVNFIDVIRRYGSPSTCNWQRLCIAALGIAAFSPAAFIEQLLNKAKLEKTSIEQPPIFVIGHWRSGTTYLHKDKFSRGLGKFHAVEFKPPAETTDKDYPLTLTTGRIMFHFHTGTMSRRVEKLNKEVPEAYVEIHPNDAKQVGLNGNKKVKVSSRRGKIELVARVTDRIKPGVVFIPFHFAEAAANALTNGAFDPIAKIPEYKVCAVNVEEV